jgi:glyoxylase-like metal-dependent hydrolase (beta-lactamase superfamily II)
MEAGVTAILTEPTFAIGQRGFLIESGGGNVLWDCITLLDPPTVEEIRSRGGISVIAISHPHYYATMVEWAETFEAPIFLHAADRQWVMRPDQRIRFWEGDTLPLHDGMTLVRAGGHFEGGALLHVPAVADNRGGLFTGDIIQVVPDRRWVSFMYSYPNLIPLSESSVRKIATSVEPYTFERVYGAFHPREVMSNGEEVIRKSAARYIHFLNGSGS